MTAGELRVLCAAAGVAVPEEDLPALLDAVANQLAAGERLRAVDLTGVEPSASFDPRWR